ncbi:MAG TPA: HAD family phosphatase [Caldimonas sp.]|jgi:HAD superfamily hydrolase (TIGR01509 family)|nr:HAD family phosphatase [Caldimonas sp.]HEX2541620.1 HAD family phosphatase [Caldimonas sp.]
MTATFLPRQRRSAAEPLAIEALVFDMDGLLLDTERLAFRALQQAGAELGLEMPESLCHSMIGVAADKSRLLLLERHGDAAPADALFAAAARHLEAQVEAGLLDVKAGVPELLSAAEQAGLPKAVATSSARQKALRHLHAAGIDGRFDAIVTRDDVERGKPHPDLFLRAAAALGTAPERCLALEDSYNGVRAAHAAGMPVVMVPDLLAPSEEMHRLCRAVLTDLHAVLPLLGRGGDR